MVEKLVTSIMEMQLKREIIRKDDIKIYQYGYTLLIEVFINIVLSCAISILMGKFKECVFFMCAFIPLRSFCGGYHADKTWKCIIISNIFIVSAILYADCLTTANISLFWRLIGDVYLGIIIMCFSPSESNNNKLSDTERCMYKRCVLVILFIEMLVGIVLILLGHNEIFNIILVAHIIQTISLIMVIPTKRKGLPSVP